MPASKKRASTKKASSKKTAAKKSAAKKSPTASVSGDRLKLSFPLDAAKAAAIRRCIAKGTLSVTVSKVNLGGGRIEEPWLYD
jgi:anti-sigma28 factor (negative regulator of flagellin synthesis)